MADNANEGQEPKEPKITEVPPAKTEPEKPKARVPDSKPEPEKAKAPRELDEDGDDLPEAEDMFQLSRAALAKRLARHSRKELKAMFGTDDVEKIKADQEELKTHRSEAEARRLAALTEKQRLEEEKRKAEKERDDAKSELQAERDRLTFAGYDDHATDALEKHIDPEAYELATAKLKKHVLDLDDEELKDTKKVFDKFLADWAKKNPKFAKAEGEEKKPEIRKVPLTTGGGGREKPTAQNPSLANKTPKPGQVNSMGKAEYADWKKANGIKF